MTDFKKIDGAFTTLFALMVCANAKKANCKSNLKCGFPHQSLNFKSKAQDLPI